MHHLMQVLGGITAVHSPRSRTLARDRRALASEVSGPSSPAWLSRSSLRDWWLRRSRQQARGKQRRGLRRLTTEDAFACVQARARGALAHPDAWQHPDVWATTGTRHRPTDSLILRILKDRRHQRSRTRPLEGGAGGDDNGKLRPPTGTIVQSWVPIPVAEQLNAQAELERRSVSSLIKLAIEDRLRGAPEQRP